MPSSWNIRNRVSSAVNASSDQCTKASKSIVFKSNSRAKSCAVGKERKTENSLNYHEFKSFDKIIIEREGLNCCPKLDFLPNLRHLSLQYNNLKSLKGLSSLKHLSYLNCYNNQLEEISGLKCLINLEILILGRNKITRIQNLDKLTRLDVLDLHANQIEKIENLGGLKSLRLLNLANNQISSLENISCLEFLREINIRRNAINSIEIYSTFPRVTKLFIGHNNISDVDEALKLSRFTGLLELTIENNPFLGEIENFSLHFPNLKLFNNKKILMNESSKKALQNVKISQKNKKISKNQETFLEEEISTNIKSQVQNEEQKIILPQFIPEFSNSDKTELIFVDLESLNNFETQLSPREAENIVSIIFHDLKVEDIFQKIDKIASFFSNITNLNFLITGSVIASQLKLLIAFPNLQKLSITDHDCHYNSRYWLYYCLWALSEVHTLVKFNSFLIDVTERKRAFEMFSAAVDYCGDKIPPYRIHALLSAGSEDFTKDSNKADLFFNLHKSFKNNYDWNLAQNMVQKCFSKNQAKYEKLTNIYNKINYLLPK